MKKIIMSGILLSISNVAFAEPAYLECSSKNADGVESLYSIKLDESTGKITHTHGNGSAFNADGFFSANEITYKSVRDSGGLLISDQYTIDRSSLGITRTLSTEPADPSFRAQMPRKIIMNVAGTCELAQIKNRKI